MTEFKLLKINYPKIHKLTKSFKIKNPIKNYNLHSTTYLIRIPYVSRNLVLLRIFTHVPSQFYFSFFPII